MHNTLHRLQVKHKTLSAVNKDPTSSNVRQWNKFTGAWGITATAYNTRQLVCICSASYVSCERDAACVCCWAQAVQQLINISCPPGAQQQTRSSRVQMMGQTDRQTDTWLLHKTCSAYYTSSITNSAIPRYKPLNWQTGALLLAILFLLLYFNTERLILLLQPFNGLFSRTTWVKPVPER